MLPTRSPAGPDPAKPWYHIHELFPNLQGHSMPGVGWKLGLAPGLGINYHNSAIQEMPNGDLLAAYYNGQQSEDDPDQTILIMRRRAGCRSMGHARAVPHVRRRRPLRAGHLERQSPSRQDLDVLRLLRASSARRPFAYMTSTDNGVTWSPVMFPTFPKPIGRYVSQPINSIVRAKDGTIYIPTDSTGKDADGNGSISVVWATRDEGKTWYDTGGRTAGRHTTIVIAKNGDLLGFGGKNSNIDGRMPLARSTDGGKTWNKSKTPFDPLASGQRPSVLRLASGRLFFVARPQPAHGKHTHQDGAYVALSDDDGANWTMKRLPPDIVTVGYTTATQGPDGTIHIVTSKNSPNYEIELNEAWILDKNAGAESATRIAARDPQSFVEHDPRTKQPIATWMTVRSADGRILLNDRESFSYPDGKLMYSASFLIGRKVGDERYLREDGTPIWEKHYDPGGTWTWDNFDASGKRIATSHWRGKTLLSSDVPDPPARKISSTEKPPSPDTE